MPQLARAKGGWSTSSVRRRSSGPASGEVRDAGESGRARAAGAGASARVCARRAELIVSDTRISLRIEEIRYEVDDDEHERHEENAALDRRQIALLDRGEHVTPEPGPAEDRFRENAAGEIVARIEAEHGDHGDQGVPEPVPQDHDALGEAFGPGGPYEVARQHLEHRRASHAGEKRDGPHAERQ